MCVCICVSSPASSSLLDLFSAYLLFSFASMLFTLAPLHLCFLLASFFLLLCPYSPFQFRLVLCHFLFILLSTSSLGLHSLAATCSSPHLLYIFLFVSSSSFLFFPLMSELHLLCRLPLCRFLRFE